MYLEKRIKLLLWLFQEMWFSDKSILKKKKRKIKPFSLEKRWKAVSLKVLFCQMEESKNDCKPSYWGTSPWEQPTRQSIGQSSPTTRLQTSPGGPGLQLTPPTAWKPHNNTRMFPLQTSPGGPRLQVTPPTAWKPHNNTRMFPLQTSPGRPGLQETPPTAWKPHGNTRMFSSLYLKHET